MAKDIEQLIQESAQETRRHLDAQLSEVRQGFDENAAELKGEVAESRRHFDVVAEDLRSQLQTIAEGVELNAARLDRLEGMEYSLQVIKDDVEVMKVDLQVIKRELRQKVDYEEFSALEEWVNSLEAKLRE